jgi:hypothetical protein
MLNILNPYQRARLLLLIGAAISFFVFWYGGKWGRVPEYPGYQASLFLSESIGMPLIVVAGLVALSARGGGPRETILWGIGVFGKDSIFSRFIVELFALTILIGVGWWVLRMLYSAGTIKDRETGKMREGEMGGAIAELSSLALQFLVTALGVMLIAQSEAKQQVMAAIFIGSWGGAIIAHMAFGTGSRGGYWLPPLVVGLFGYVLAYFFEPTGLVLADFRGAFAGLYRAMPLDYASMGPAGAIVGHWMSRRWQRDKENPAKLLMQAVGTG